MNEVWDLIDNYFLAFNISFIPIITNEVANSLAITASSFKPPLNPDIVHEIQMKHKPSIPNNIKHWKVFEDDQEIKRFIVVVEEFSISFVDQD